MITLSYFTAPWCASCKSTTVICERIQSERTDVIVSIYNVDTSEGSAMAAKHNITSLPSIIISGPGGTKSFIGSHASYGAINEAINEVSRASLSGLK